MGITHHTLHLQCHHKSTVHISPPLPTLSPSPSSSSFASSPPVSPTSHGPRRGPPHHENQHQTHSSHHHRPRSTPTAQDSPPPTPTSTSTLEQSTSSNTYSKHDSICPRCIHEKREARNAENRISTIAVIIDHEPEPEDSKPRRSESIEAIYRIFLLLIENWKFIIALLLAGLAVLFLSLKGTVLWYTCLRMVGRGWDLFTRARSGEMDLEVGMRSLLQVVWKVAVYVGLCVYGVRTFVRLSMKTRRGRNWWVWI